MEKRTNGQKDKWMKRTNGQMDRWTNVMTERWTSGTPAAAQSA